MKSFWIALSFIFLSSLGWATPATNLNIGYSLDTHTLFLDADHPTDRQDRYYIHEVVVTRNGQDQQHFYFSHQARADKFIANLDYVANPGDHLDIKLVASEGGVTEGSIDVAAPSSMRERNEQTPPVPDRR